MLLVLLDNKSIFEIIRHLQRCDTIMGANKLRRKQIFNIASKAEIPLPVNWTAFTTVWMAAQIALTTATLLILRFGLASKVLLNVIAVV